jgi:cellulose synthase/poly-beta-1,6-N-acetylglucosamine synthase-like glycosyltransferase
MSLVNAISLAFTLIFLLIILSYYLLLFKRQERHKKGRQFSSITVIIPAHNEEKYLSDCIRSVLEADFKGRKEVIVVDDGSRDKTASIAGKFGSRITLIRSVHSGKSASINKALSRARGELVAIVDADSVIEKGSLAAAEREFYNGKVAAVTSVIKVRNRHTFLGLWLHIEQLYNSLLRSLFAKINVNIVTPGPLSVYRRDCLRKINGFNTKGLSEDVDVALRLLKAGYTIRFSDKSVSETTMPVDPKGFARQRNRFARGWINIFKKHLRLDHTFMSIYTLPLAFFGYFQAVVMGLITLYNLGSGYYQYFLSQGVYLNLAVCRFFFDWLSIFGTAGWIWRIATAGSAPSPFDIIGICTTLLSYPLYLIAIIKFEGKVTFWHIIPLLFMFPFWLLIMFFYIFNVKEFLNGEQENIWAK